MKYALILSCLFLNTKIYAQNVFEPLTRPIANLHAYLGPSSVGFENNLMNYISDELRVDDDVINQPISCFGDEGATGHHFHKKRNLRIKCDNQDALKYAMHKVSEFYGHEVGHHLKYAFRSGKFIFAVCNYDSPGEHKHSQKHYVCRVPLDSKEKGIETFCYNMGYFHRTCNPHKALVAAEIIPINSRRRWADIDKSILVRFLENNSELFSSEGLMLNLVADISSSRVSYSQESRGSATATKRYPKVFVGNSYLCSEDLVVNGSEYVETQVSCGLSVKINRRQSKLGQIIFQKRMLRLKQKAVDYPMIRGEKSSVDK